MYNLGGGNSFKINSLANRAISTFFAVIFFFALGAIVDSREARGQCPGGFIQTSITMTVNYTSPPRSCNYLIVLCYKCGVTGVNPSNFRPKTIHALGSCSVPYLPSTDLTEFQEAFRVAMFEAYLDLCSYPPCPSTVQEEISRIPICWKVVYNQYTDRYFLAACENDYYCTTTREVCLDYSTTPPTPVIGTTNTQVVGQESCEEMIYIQLPEDPPHNWESDCFLWYSCP